MSRSRSPGWSHKPTGRFPCTSTGVVGTGVPPSGSALIMSTVIVGWTRTGAPPGCEPSTPSETTLPRDSAQSWNVCSAGQRRHGRVYEVALAVSQTTTVARQPGGWRRELRPSGAQDSAARS